MNQPALVALADSKNQIGFDFPEIIQKRWSLVLSHWWINSAGSQLKKSPKNKEVYEFYKNVFSAYLKAYKEKRGKNILPICENYKKHATQQPATR